MTRVRSAKSGRFVEASRAKTSPSTTVNERPRRGYQPSKAVLRALAAFRATVLRWLGRKMDHDYALATTRALNALDDAVFDEANRQRRASKRGRG